MLVVSLWHSPLNAQAPDEDGRFYLGFAGSAVFPYDPKAIAGRGLKAGAGFTAAFGYAFKEGFSTEIEWGYQKVGIGDPSGSGGGVVGDFSCVLGDETNHCKGFLPVPAVKIDGEIKTPSLMGNFYYRYPKWRVSPYVGFGLGAFFHNRIVTSTFTERNPFPNNIIPASRYDEPRPPSALSDQLSLTVAHKNSRFAYQIMGGLSVRASQLVEFRLGYRFRSSRGAPIDADLIEAGIRFRF